MQAHADRVLGASGDDDFDAFFRTHHARLSQALYLMVGDRQQAEDLAQEAFIRTLVRWSRVREMDSPDGFLFRVALNLGRRAKTPRRLQIVSLQQVEASTDVGDSSDLRLDVHQALQGLPRDQREALALVDWLGMDSKSAARILAIKPVSVRARVHRARRALRSSLAQWRPSSK